MELRPGPSLTNGRRVARALAVFVFAVGLAICGASVVGTHFEPVLLIPVGLAVLVGWSASRQHIVIRAVIQVAAFVASGMAIAFVDDGVATAFGHGLLDGPQQILTTAWPSPRFSTIFVAIGALIFVATAISIDLAMRVRWRSLPIVPMVVAMAVLIGVGAPDGPQWQAVVCAVVASFVLLWIGLDDRVASLRSGVPIAVSAGLAALLVAMVAGVAVADRANPRRSESANSQVSLVDPLADVTSQQDKVPPIDLYEVRSSDLPELHLWRTAAVDVYNGESWSVSGRLVPVGNRLDEPTGAKKAVVTIVVRRQDVDLWAVPGRLLRSSSPVEAGLSRRVVTIVDEKRPTQTVFTVEPLIDFDPATAGSLPAIQPTDIESSFAGLARESAPDGTIADKVASLASALKTGYKLNTEVPGGVQEHIVNGFLRTTRIGNEQQFLTGFVLMARSLGVDARIATGYRLDTADTAATISTKNAEAWPEVRLANGWAAVDVLPEPTNAPPVEAPAGQPETPPAAQPQDPPKVEQADPNKPVEAPLPPADAKGWEAVRVWAMRGGIFTGLLLWPLLLFAIVVSWKKLRRRKGLKAPDPARRVSTAWTLATDALVDAGATLQTSHTNAELVEAGVRSQPTAGPPLGRLQRHADAVTFATSPCDPKRADDAVDQLRLVESSIRNSSSRWWRWKWWLSTRSLRRRTQSPLR